MSKTIRIIGFVASIALTGCKSDSATPQPAQAVRVETVVPGGGRVGSARYSGVAQPNSQVALAFRVPGYVSQLMAVKGSDGKVRQLAEGDRVKRGDVLVRLRDTEYRDKVEQAKGQASAARAAAEKARLDWERANRLIATQSITRPEFDAARAQRDATQAQLSGAEATLQEASLALRDTALLSPLDAEVVKKAVEPGALVGPGTLAFLVADTSAVKVVVGVPDVLLRSLALGQNVTVTSDALPGQRFQARISRIASAADPTTRNFDVEMAIPNPQRIWKAGLITSVELGSDAAVAGPPLLPFSAIVQAKAPGGGFAVLVAEGEGSATTARLRKVELGEVSGNRVAVVSGLAPGERVITVGGSLLADDERIEILP